MSSPTSRTLAKLKSRGIPAQVVEKWIAIKGHPGGGVRRDLFNIIDIVALRGCIWGIQATSAANVSKRIEKINAEPLALEWIRAGGSLSVFGWSKKGKRGKRKLWACRVMVAEVLPGGCHLCWNEEIDTEKGTDA